MSSQIKKNTQRIERALQAVEQLTKQEINQLQTQQNLLELRKKRIASLKNNLSIFGSTFQFQSTKRDSMEQQKAEKHNTDPWSIFKRTPVIEYKIPERNFEKQFENKINKYRQQCFQKFIKVDDQQSSSKSNPGISQSSKKQLASIERKQSPIFNNINQITHKNQVVKNPISTVVEEQKKEPPAKVIGFVPGKVEGLGQSLFQKKFEAPPVDQPKAPIFGNKLFSDGNPIAQVKQQKNVVFNQNLSKKNQVQIPPLLFMSSNNNKANQGQSQIKSLFTGQSSQKSLFPNIKNQPIKINFFNNTISKQQKINQVTDMNRGQFKFGQGAKKTDAAQQLPSIPSNQQKKPEKKVDQPLFKMNVGDNSINLTTKEGNFMAANTSTPQIAKKYNLFEPQKGLISDPVKSNNQDQKSQFSGNLGFNIAEKQKDPSQLSSGNIFSQKAQTNNLLPQTQNNSTVFNLNTNINLGIKNQPYESGSLFSGIPNPLLAPSNSQKSNQPSIQQDSKNSLFSQKSGVTLFPNSIGSNNLKSAQLSFPTKSKQQSQIKQPSEIIGNFVKSKQGGLFSSLPIQSSNKTPINSLFTSAQPLGGNSLFQQPSGSLFGNPSGSLFGNSNKGGALFSNQGKAEGGKLFQQQSQEDGAGEGDDEGIIEDKSEIDPTKSTGNYQYEESKTLFKETIPKIKKGANNIIENVTVSIEKFNNSSNSLMCVRLANKCPYFTGFIVPNLTEISQLGDSPTEYRNLCIKKIMINQNGKASLEVLKLQFKDNNHGFNFFQTFKKQMEKKN